MMASTGLDLLQPGREPVLLDEEEDPEDDEEWAKQEGVPSFKEPFIQKYLEGRDALIATEKKQRSGIRIH